MSNYYQQLQNWFWKQEKELSKQKMDLLLLLPDLQSKNFFYKTFSIFTRDFKKQEKKYSKHEMIKK